MKKQIFLLLFITTILSAAAQNKIIFPGLTEAQKQ